ncbi:MAG: hypothetical protein AB7L66_07980 [Gemmatimonadales bacterium]
MRLTPYLLGAAYIGLCGLAIARSRPAPATAFHPEPARFAEVPAADDAGAWFAAVKPYCNALEVETALQQRRPPAGMAGTAHEAACLALAGKIEPARALIGGLPAGERWRAAGVVFEIAHPVADAGDDRSAGPIMAMVADFWPNHYMALYHAGMSEFALGDRAAARRHLEAFMENYQAEDGWRSSARGALEQLGK